MRPSAKLSHKVISCLWASEPSLGVRGVGGPKQEGPKHGDSVPENLAPAHWGGEGQGTTLTATYLYTLVRQRMVGSAGIRHPLLTHR